MTDFKAVVLDWAGTTVDFGCFAPMDVFIATFAQFGVSVTIAEARLPMGLPKREHIRALMQQPRIATEWQRVHGVPPDEAAIDRVYAVFVPMNEEVVVKHATLVPGARAAIERLRACGLRIGSTTGYTRSIMQRLLPLAAAQGYAPDCVVCADDMRHGRPTPLNMYRCFIELAIWPAGAVIKVDDTAPGIAEGVAAGCVTVGVTLSGNAVGHSPAELAALPAAEVQRLRGQAADHLRAAGADHVIDTVADLPALIERL